jgi:hypothetical protein
MMQCGGTGFCKLLCCDFICSEETTAGATGSAHCMLMAGFMKIWLADK